MIKLIFSIPNRPDHHQPQSSGPPMNSIYREGLLRPRITPSAHGRNRRLNTQDSLVWGYGIPSIPLTQDLQV